MAIGSLVAAIPLSSNHALIGQFYSDSLEMQDNADIKPVEIARFDGGTDSLDTSGREAL